MLTLKTRVLSFGLTSLLGLSLFGCAADDAPVESGQTRATQQLCDDASEKVQQCFGQEAKAPQSCDESSARNVMAQSCDELKNRSNAKADQFCNPFLWWTWSSCGGSTTPSIPAGTYDVRALIDVCGGPLEFCDQVLGDAECTVMTVEDAKGNVIAKERTNQFSVAKFTGLKLEEGETYTLNMYRRDGELGEMLIDRLNEKRTQGPSSMEFVAGEDQELRMKMKIHRDEVPKVEGCGSVTGQVTSTCEGAPMDVEETEWSWLVRLDDQNGEQVDIIRPLRRQTQNRFGFRNLLPGKYTVTFLEMDIPSWKQKPNPDYDELAGRYATGRKLEDKIEFKESSIGDWQELGEYLLDHEDCK